MPPSGPVFDYAVQKAFHGFYAALHDAIDNFPVRRARARCSNSACFRSATRFRKPKDSLAKTIVRGVLEPGEVRDRLTRYIFVSHDENDPTGAARSRHEKGGRERGQADKKLERAIRSGTVKRYLGNDWFKEALDKGVLSQGRPICCARPSGLCAKVIAVDDFDRGGGQAALRAGR